AHRRALLLGQTDDVQTILRHVDSAKREHLRNPSLLMRARAQATVRVWKKRLELQAHSRSQSCSRAYDLPAERISNWGGSDQAKARLVVHGHVGHRSQKIKLSKISK